LYSKASTWKGCLFHVSWKWKLIFRKSVFKFFYICWLKLVNGKYFSVNKKHFPVKGKFDLISRKVFSFYFGRKTLSEVVKNLEMSYYLLIISNLILKVLIAIYILFWIFVFQFHPLEFNFYIKFGPIFIIVICFSLIIF